MKNHLKVLLAAIFLAIPQTISAACFAAENPISQNKLNGAFIQFDESSLDTSPADWDALISGMYKNGVRSLVIQWSNHDVWDREKRPYKFLKNIDFTATSNDVVEKVMKIADSKNMKVHIGLNFSDSWWDEESDLFEKAKMLVLIKANYEKAIKDRDDAVGRETDERVAELTTYVGNHKRILEGAEAAMDNLLTRKWSEASGESWVKPCVSQVSTIHDKYGKHASFAGLYIPQEIPNRKIKEKWLKALTSSFKGISLKHKSYGKGTIAFSPFRAEVGAEPADAVETAKLFTEFLQNSGVSLMMPQDSVGLNHWETRDAIQNGAIPFLKACKEAAGTDVSVIPIVECWKQYAPNDIRACSIGRLLEQLSLESELFPNQTLQTFDLNHHLNPAGKNEAKILRQEVDKLHSNP